MVIYKQYFAKTLSDDFLDNGVADRVKCDAMAE